MDSDNPPLLEVSFSYQVEGHHFSGTYTEEFLYRAEAEQMLGSLRKGPLFVRYNTAKPEECFMDPYHDLRA